ncbi:MAG: DNA-binding protein [Kineosporiaceae bacterium]
MSQDGATSPPGPPPRRRRERKAVLLRLDPELHDALARWAADDLRSTNAQLEWLLTRALAESGRLHER